MGLLNGKRGILPGRTFPTDGNPRISSGGGVSCAYCLPNTATDRPYDLAVSSTRRNTLKNTLDAAIALLAVLTTGQLDAYIQPSADSSLDAAVQANQTSAGSLDAAIATPVSLGGATQFSIVSSVPWGVNSDTGTSFPSGNVSASVGQLIVVTAIVGLDASQSITWGISDNTSSAITWSNRVNMQGATHFGGAAIWTGVVVAPVSSKVITVATGGSTQVKGFAACAYVLSGQDASPIGNIPTPIDSGSGSAAIQITVNVQAIGSFLFGAFQRGNSTTFPSLNVGPTTLDGSAYHASGGCAVGCGHLTSVTDATGNKAFGSSTSDTYTIVAAIEIKANTAAGFPNLDSYIGISGSASGSLDAAIQDVETTTSNLDAYIVLPITSSTSLLDAVIQGSNSTTSSLDTCVDVALTIDSGGRYLLRDGSPFRIQGDAAWSGIANLSYANQTSYLDDRASRGFNAVLVNLFEKHFSDQAPNAKIGSTAPFDGSSNATYDFSTLSSAYLDIAEAFVDYAKTKGIVVFLDALYLGNSGNQEGWWAALTNSINTQSVCYAFGQALGTRFKSKTNIIWVMGGDYSCPAGSEGETRLHKIAEGIKNVGATQYMTFHGWNGAGTLSTDQAAFTSYCDINGAYSYTDVLDEARSAWSYGTKPAFLFETRYENEIGDPTGTRVNVRNIMWQGYLGTIGGSIFGADPIWPFDSTDTGAYRISSTNPFDTWAHTIGAPGSLDYQRMGAFLDSIEWWRLVPEGLSGAGTVRNTGGITAAITAAKDLAVTWVSSGNITVNNSVMSGTYRAQWWDPTDGTLTLIGSSYANTGTQTFTNPGTHADGGGTDWLLVLDSANTTSSINGTLDAAVQGPVTGSGTLDAAIQGEITLAGTLDAAIQDTGNSQGSLDSIIGTAPIIYGYLDSKIVGALALSGTLDAEIITEQSVQLSGQLDAAISLGRVGYGYLDAKIQSDRTETSPLDSVIQDTLTSGGTLDAVLIILSSTQSTLDSAVQGTGSTVGSLDTYVGTSQSANGSIDSLVQDTITSNSILDTVVSLAATADRTLDAVIQSALTLACTLDSAIQDSLTNFSNLDTAIQGDGTTDGSLDSHIGTSRSVSGTIDSAVQADFTLAPSFDAIVAIPLNANGSFDSAVQADIVGQGSLDSVVQGPATATGTLDSSIQSTESTQGILDGSIQSNLTTDSLLDTVIQDSLTAFGSLDTIVQHSITNNGSLDTIVIIQPTSDSLLDTVVQAVLTLEASLDTAVQGPVFNPGSLDAAVSLQTSGSWTSDAVVQGTVTSASSLDSIVQDNVSVNGTLDVIVQLSTTIDGSIDAVVILQIGNSGDIDAVVQGASDTSGTLDARIILEAVPGTLLWFADAIIQARISTGGSVDVVVQDNLTVYGSLDASITLTQNIDGLLDVAVQGTGLSDGSLDTAVQLTVTETSSLDSIVQASLTEVGTLDTVVIVGTSVAGTLDAAIQGPVTGSGSLDAYVASPGTLSGTLDAAIQGSGAINGSLDSFILILGSTGSALDVVIQLLSYVTSSLNALVQGPVSLAGSLDTSIFVGYNISGSFDTIVQTHENAGSSFDTIIQLSPTIIGWLDTCVESIGFSEGNFDTAIADSFQLDCIFDAYVTPSVEGSLDTVIQGNVKLSSSFDAAIDGNGLLTSESLERAMETARILIAKYGTDVDLIKYVDSVPENVVKPWRINSTTSIIQTVKAVWLRGLRFSKGLSTDAIMDEGVPSEDRRVLIAAKGITDAPGLRGEIKTKGGTIWTIVSIQEVAPDGNAIVYILQVR